MYPFCYVSWRLALGPFQDHVCYAQHNFTSNWGSNWTNWPMVQWTNGKMEKWSKGPMDQWTNSPLAQWPNGQMTQWTNRKMEKWSNGAMYQWSNGAMDQWTNRPIGIWHSFVALVTSIALILFKQSWILYKFENFIVWLILKGVGKMCTGCCCDSYSAGSVLMHYI